MVAVVGLVVLPLPHLLAAVALGLRVSAAMRQEPQGGRQEQMEVLLVQQVIQWNKQIWAVALALGV